MGTPQRAERNQTLDLSKAEAQAYSKRLLRLTDAATAAQVINKTILGDCRKAAACLPKGFVDLLIADPPYNLNKKFGSQGFSRQSQAAYTAFTEGWLLPLLPLLKPTATVYVCGDWLSSPSLYEVLSRHLTVRNRITWQREKGRGARRNWKNGSEDIWFCTAGTTYTFNIDAVKEKRKVIAPYREAGKPKDWEATDDGNYRLTHPSNLWTDISVPFWSMPENTDHPTQKPEKLMAKLLLASSNAGDVVLDPFLGSGTTSVTAKKLGRSYIGIEADRHWACIAEKRLALAERKPEIQGYEGGVFWERNTLQERRRKHGT